MKEFEHLNYWAVILGGSTGLGLAAALKLAGHGMHICIVHRNTRSEMEQVSLSFDQIKAMGVKLLTFNADVTKTDEIISIMEKIRKNIGEGKVRCLLHSIAKGNLKPMASSTGPVLEVQDFVLTLQNMAISLYDWTEKFTKAALFAGDARVISFTSEGSGRAWKNYAAVAAAKAALEAITRSIALEFAPYGVRANCIQAGVTPTKSLKMIPGSDELIRHTLARNPFKRLTSPEDIANMVYLLCKDEASWLNGAIIPVDGGEHIS